MPLGTLLSHLTHACFWSNVSFLPTQNVTSCLKGLPFSPQWRDGTVKTLTQFLPNYVLLDSLTDTGPPANIRVDLMNALGKIAATEFAMDMDMQSAFAKLFNSIHDGHTVYTKCDAYSNLAYTQPFALKVTAEGPSQKVFLGGEARPGLIEYLGGDYASLQGLEILSIDGTAPVTAITNWADINVPQSQDQGVRFNIALFVGYFVTRNILIHDVPEGLVEYVLRDASAVPVRTLKVKMPWTAIARAADLPVDISVEACTKAQRLPPRSNFGSHVPGPRFPQLPTFDSPLLPEVTAPTGWTEVLSEPPLTLYTSDDGTTGVLKLSSFSPNNYTAHCDNIQKALKILADTGVHNLVIDVLRNGGGYVCLGYNFLRLLVPTDLLNAPPSIYEGSYDLPWTMPVSTALRNNATAVELLGLQEYIDAATGKHVTHSAEFYDSGPTYIRGDVANARRSNRFYLDCDEQDPPDYGCDLTPPPITFSKKHLLVLTDGYCGSTCATFMHRLQAGEYATVAGVGGIKHVPMSSSSFAGGFTSNLNRLNEILQPADKITEYPSNGGVYGFAQGEMYDYLRKDTPAQYAWNRPDVRFDFWDFAGDLGPLYNMAKNTFPDAVLV